LKSIYKPKGVCISKIVIEVEDGVVQSVRFTGGCDGNLEGIARLVVGMSAVDVISRLEGTLCDNRDTSCPDQLAQALKALDNPK